MKFNRRLEKLEKTAVSLPCSTCRDWWQEPLVIRYEWEPPGPDGPDRCPRCGRQPAYGLIRELVIANQTDPPGPYSERL